MQFRQDDFWDDVLGTPDWPSSHSGWPDKVFWQTLVVVDPFHNLFTEHAKFGDCSDSIRVCVRLQSHRALTALATSVAGTRS